jgi:hypothetical protein
VHVKTAATKAIPKVRSLLMISLPAGRCEKYEWLLGTINEDFDTTYQLGSAFVQYFRKKNWEYAEADIKYLYTSRKLMIRSGWRYCIISS